MPANLKVIYTQGVPIVADFAATDGPPLVVNHITGRVYYLDSTGAVAQITLPAQSISSSITAAGTTQGTATALSAAINYISTAAANSGVLLAGSLGNPETVYNGGANPVNVYPPVGARINQMASNSPHILPINTCARYEPLTSTQILGLMSA
jgi:hypothetical protein